MSRTNSYFPLRAAVLAGFTLLEVGAASAQSTNSVRASDATELSPASNPDNPAPASESAAPPESFQSPAAPAVAPAPGASEAAGAQDSAVLPPNSREATPAPGALPPQPLSLPRNVVLERVRLKLLKRDRRAITLGVGPLVLANTHWLDQPSDKSVNVGTLRGADNAYPGFVGMDATLGLMLDFRYLHFLGVEIDLFLQNDRGTGTITIEDAGSICFIPGVKLAFPSHSYNVTIGQMAWHVPVLFKLSLPGRLERVTDGNDVDHEIRRNFATLAFGPEFVFPRSATFKVDPSTGLEHPDHAFASNYLMYTGALGFERRLSTSHDIRLLLSARGSYNPSAGNSAMKRAEYETASGSIVAVAYRSEWRYQAAFTLGLGWFF